MPRYVPRDCPPNIDSFRQLVILSATRPLSDRVAPSRRRDSWVQRAAIELPGKPSRKLLGMYLLDEGILTVGGNTPYFVLPNDGPLYWAARRLDDALLDCIKSRWAERQTTMCLACNFRCSPILVAWLRSRLTLDCYPRVSGLIPSGQPEAIAAGLVESTPWPEGWSVEECACSIGVLPRAFAAELRRLAG